ncbi:nicotianamine synthase-like [Magnolia sinica]|uniref:nicotianamine synthase-like n=1 Tax=Magnolia sinica TaxID=86752 RepID=UPI00265A9474|nr:nicotianamine synthase-like [Magnolia sinica]
MASLQPSIGENHMSDDLLIAAVTKIHVSICKLDNLRPSKHVNSLLTQLVKLCTLPSSIDIKNLPEEAQQMRKNLIRLCGRAEGLLELEVSSLITKFPHPMSHLNLYPYYTNYLELAHIEHKILCDNGIVQFKRVAFVGSGSMPLTSIIMATHYMKSTYFDNYDIDESANQLARRIVGVDSDLGRRMRFKTCDVMDVREELGGFDCMFLAALVGMSREEKVRILGHMRKYMKCGSVLVVRSANGSRGFLYPVVEDEDLGGFEILSVFHPTNEVINSVVLVRKPIV